MCAFSQALNGLLGPQASPLGTIGPLRRLDAPALGPLPSLAPALPRSIGSSGGLEPIKTTQASHGVFPLLCHVFLHLYLIFFSVIYAFPRQAAGSSGTSGIRGGKQHERMVLLTGFEDDDDNDLDTFDRRLLYEVVESSF